MTNANSVDNVTVTGGAHVTKYQNRKDTIPRSSYERRKGTLMRSDCDQKSRTDYDRGTQREPRSDCEQRSRTDYNRGTQREPERDRSRTRSEHNTPMRIQTDHGRERAESTKERAQMRRRRHLMLSLANIPIQMLDPSDHQYKGKEHKRLLIRSLAEK